MAKFLKQMISSEKGFTYVELMVAIVIFFLVCGAATTATFQVLKGAERNSNYATALRQVQSAGYWISRDTQMAQSIIIDELTPPDFLILNWTEEGSGNEYQITYTLESMPSGNMKKLMRKQTVIGGGANTTTFIANYIDLGSGKTDCQLIGGTLTLTVTASLGGGLQEGSETRIYRITPRPG